jgi:acyl-CoA thioesterase-1
MGSDMSLFFRARLSRRRLLHFSLSACALLALGDARAAMPASSTPLLSSGHAVLVVGDSLSAEYGLARGSGWVSLLAQRLAASKPGWTVRNASISGDTTAGGLARLPALLREERPRVVILELGANDALRGLPLTDTRRNLDAMIDQSTAAGARVLLVGMQVPPNFGRQYTTDFARLYVDLAAAHKVALVPFLLKGIADRPDADDWFQSDQMHPLAKAHPIILDNVWPALQPLLK